MFTNTHGLGNGLTNFFEILLHEDYLKITDMMELGETFETTTI